MIANTGGMLTVNGSRQMMSSAVPQSNEINDFTFNVTITGISTGFVDMRALIDSMIMDQTVTYNLPGGKFTVTKMSSERVNVNFYDSNNSRVGSQQSIYPHDYLQYFVSVALVDDTYILPITIVETLSHVFFFSFFNASTVHTMLAEFTALFDDGYINSNDPYATAPESDPDGGFGDFDYGSDIIDLPSAPSISVSDSGFITLYKPSLQQLRDLAAYMWSGLFDLATFRKIFADPMDCIISLTLIPVSPTVSGSQELKVGNIGTGLTIDKLSSQFVEVNFAQLNIGLRTNGFMDFSPYTKAQIFLPFIGTRSISIDDIAGRNIKLKYIIDLFTGACNASLAVEVTAKNGKKQYTTLYQFTGNVLADIPITANNFTSFLQATVGAVSTAVGVATGAGAIAGVASAINSAASMKPDIEKSGNLSATAGFLGVQKPYLILTYPNLCRPEGRDKVVGTPSFLGMKSGKKLSSFHGFTVLHKVNVKGVTCTEEEKELIRAQLTGEGVIMP